MKRLLVSIFLLASVASAQVPVIQGLSNLVTRPVPTGGQMPVQPLVDVIEAGVVLRYTFDPTNTLSTNRFRVGTNAVGRWLYEWNGDLRSVGNPAQSATITESIGLAADAKRPIWSFLPRTLYLVGDSITYGASVSASSNRWGNRVALANAWISTNLAYGSAGMPDYIFQSYPGFSFTNLYDSAVGYSPGQITTSHQWALLAGYNDMRDFGTEAAKVEGFKRGLMAWIGWVGSPTEKLQMAQAAVKTGSWSNMSWFGGSVGSESSTATSTLTWTNVLGDSVYVCYGDGATATNGATFTVTIDGTLAASITATNGYGNREYRNGSDPNIPNAAGPYGTGKIDTLPSVLRVPNLGLRPHTVVISNVSSTTGPLRVFWATGNAAPRSRAVESGPFVWVGGCLRQAAYTGAGSDSAAAAYTSAIVDVVSVMAADGWSVRYAPAAEAWNPFTDLSGDGVHPSDAGMEPIEIGRASCRERVFESV
jgi:hypothetical protein